MIRNATATADLMTQRQVCFVCFVFFIAFAHCITCDRINRPAFHHKSSGAASDIRVAAAESISIIQNVRLDSPSPFLFCRWFHASAAFLFLVLLYIHIFVVVVLFCERGCHRCNFLFLPVFLFEKQTELIDVGPGLVKFLHRRLGDSTASLGCHFRPNAAAINGVTRSVTTEANAT